MELNRLLLTTVIGSYSRTEWLDVKSRIAMTVGELKRAGLEEQGVSVRSLRRFSS